MIYIMYFDSICFAQVDAEFYDGAMFRAVVKNSLQNWILWCFDIIYKNWNFHISSIINSGQLKIFAIPQYCKGLVWFWKKNNPIQYSFSLIKKIMINILIYNLNILSIIYGKKCLCRATRRCKQYSNYKKNICFKLGDC